jgi:6-pyruvoyl-tetrahydropterin synthase
MYTVGVSDFVMVAHSLNDPGFGPAARLHGATYAVEVEVRARELDRLSVVLDIGLLRSTLRAVLEPLDYRNLDELEDWKGKLSTTEALCQHIHRGLAQKLPRRANVESLRVLLRESPNAWAAYEGPLAAPSAETAQAD